MKQEEKTRATFVKRSGRMRALAYLARLYPKSYAELLEEGKKEAAALYDSLDVLFKPEAWGEDN